MPQSSQTPTVGLSTYGAIRNDIIFGRLAPDFKLKLDDMKAAYRASVPTLRETLNRLASEGFVVAEEQRGFFVAPVSKSDLREIADLRILLECSALKLSIEKGDTEWEGKVAAAHHKLHRMEQKMLTEDHAERELWKRYDWEFHQSLILACGSSNLLRLHAIIFDKYLRYQMHVLTFRGEPAALEHKQLLDAALDRNADLAEVVLRSHVKAGLKHALSSSEGHRLQD